MYRMITFVSALLLVGAIGCDQPGPIEVVHSLAHEPIQVNYLLGQDADSLIVTADAQAKYDLSGVLRSEEDAYEATMLVNGAVYNLDGVNTVTQSYSKVALRDTDTPETVTGNFGQVQAYKHLDVGNVRLNGTDLDKEEVYLQIRRPNQDLGILVRNGIQYKLLNDAKSQSKSFEFRPNIDYAIEAEGKAQVSPFTERIESPDQVSITEPKPNSLVLSDEDLTLRWNGRPGKEVIVVISYYDEANASVVLNDPSKVIGKPIMELKSSSGLNAMLISRKLLNLIPKTSSGKIVITLISANRVEANIAQYSGKVLVQSASIHNETVILK